MFLFNVTEQTYKVVITPCLSKELYINKICYFFDIKPNCYKVLKNKKNYSKSRKETTWLHLVLQLAKITLKFYNTKQKDK